MQKSTLLHLRIPFSIFLMPVYLFALSQSADIDWFNAIIAFIAVHLFLYPASNGYNSYFDKDEESIGGLEVPPPVSKELYWTALLFDILGITLGLMISIDFAVGLFVYGIVSKAYSHPMVRLKKYPIISWITVGVFQGFFTYLMTFQAINNLNVADLWQLNVLLPAILSSVLLMASYPMTQVYQHHEDAKRGDKTLSLLLGIRGTFLFAGIAFFMANIGFVAYFYHFQTFADIVIFEMSLLPMLVYFTWWFNKVRQDEKQANFKYTMRLNAMSSLFISACFVILLIF